jgi:hypothetical protein
MKQRSSYRHAVFWQVDGATQMVPQVPQLALSVVKFEQMPAQSVYGAAHAHVPFTQMRFPPQLAPQNPQLVLFVLRSAQTLPGHCVAGGRHWMTQCPSEHSGAVAGHRFPQAPQFVLPDCRLTQVPTPPLGPAHCVSPAAQLQVPSTQDPPNGHVVPQDPQFALLVDKSTQTKRPRGPIGHDVSPPSPHPATHVPPWQVMVGPHLRPHAPQFASSEFGLMQVVPQRRSPGAQAQMPPAQSAPFAHCAPHVPQLRGSIARSTHALAQFVS